MAIVCQCVPVRERAVVEAIQCGASTLCDIQAVCGAGTQCGGCEPAIQQLLERHRDAAVHVGVLQASGARA